MKLSASDVVVTNARGIFDRPIAEFVLNYILIHAKNSLGSLQDQKNIDLESLIDEEPRRI